MDQILKLIKQWDVSEFAGMGRTAAQLRADCRAAIDQLYDDWVDCPEMDDGQELDYYLGVFQAIRSTPPETVEARFQLLYTHITKFREILRQREVALLADVDNLWTASLVDEALHRDITDRLSRILDSLDQMHETVLGVIRHRQTKVLAFGYPEYPENWDPESKDDKEHILHKWAYRMLFRMKARRYKGFVMLPVYTEEGHFTRTYSRRCEIDEFFKVFLDGDRYRDIWRIATKKSNYEIATLKILKSHNHKSFPDAKVSRYQISWLNGVYHIDRDRFEPYTRDDWSPRHMRGYGAASEEHRRDMEKGVRRIEQSALTSSQHPRKEVSVETYEGDISDSDSSDGEDEDNNIGNDSIHTSARPNGLTSHRQAVEEIFGDDLRDERTAMNYIKQDFPFSEIERIDDPLDIPTPALDSIFRAQGYYEMDNWREIMLWHYGLLGRLFFDLSSDSDPPGDNWQCCPLAKGVAGSGKSTLIRAIMSFFRPEDVGNMANKAEALFGLEAFLDKLLVVCMEMRGSFSTDQSDLQSMISNENLSVRRKNKVAVSIMWHVGLIIAGNTTARLQDTSGSLARRLVPFIFSKVVREMNSNLDKEINEERPFILAKLVRCYHVIRRQVRENGNNFWKTVPQYFRDQRDKLASDLNSFDQFLHENCTIASLDNEPVDDYYTDWNHLKRVYKKWCNETSAEALDMSKTDEYSATLQKYDIEIKKDKRHDSSRNCERVTQWAVGVRHIAELIGTEEQE